MNRDQRRKIGFFGGSFDPVHFGHLMLGTAACDQLELEKVLFSPAAKSPFKEGHNVTPKQRAEMVQLAIQPIKKFTLYRGEVERGGASYTFDTIDNLVANGDEIVLILTQELSKNLHQWHRAEELIERVTPFVGVSSSQGEPSFHHFSVQNREKLKAGIYQIPHFEISSTEVRRRLHSKKSCDHLVPRKVLDYIYKNELY